MVNTGATLRRDLMELMTEMEVSELGLVADKIAPPLSVATKADSYPVLPREAVMKVPDTHRAPDGSFSRGQWSWGSKSYFCEFFGHEEDLDTVHAKENKIWINEEEITAKLAVSGIKLGRESRVATAVYNPITFTGTNNLLSLSKEWDDASNATPYEDIVVKVWQGKLRPKCGLPLSMFSLIMSDDLLRYAVRTNQIKNSLLYTNPVEHMTVDQQKEMLRNFLGVKEIVLVASMYDMAGVTQDASIAKFWSNEYMMLAKLSSGVNSFKERCFARQPVYSEFPEDVAIESYPEPQRKRIVYQAYEYRGITINTDYAVLIDNCKETVGATGV